MTEAPGTHGAYPNRWLTVTPSFAKHVVAVAVQWRDPIVEDARLPVFHTAGTRQFLLSRHGVHQCKPDRFRSTWGRSVRPF
jgi:hypothetical protein